MRFRWNERTGVRRRSFVGPGGHPRRFGTPAGLGAAAGWWIGRSTARSTYERHRYHELFELTPAYVATYSIEGTLRSSNPAAASALGYAPEALVGRSLKDLVPAERRLRFDV